MILKWFRYSHLIFLLLHYLCVPDSLVCAYMLSLPHSAGDFRNYSKSPAREKQSPAISSKYKWKKLREHPALSGFQSTQNKQIVRNLPYWVRNIGLFLAGHCLKGFSESPHNEQQCQLTNCNQVWDWANAHRHRGALAGADNDLNYDLNWNYLNHVLLWW